MSRRGLSSSSRRSPETFNLSTWDDEDPELSNTFTEVSGRSGGRGSSRHSASQQRPVNRPQPRQQEESRPPPRQQEEFPDEWLTEEENEEMEDPDQPAETEESPEAEEAAPRGGRGSTRRSTARRVQQAALTGTQARWPSLGMTESDDVPMNMMLVMRGRLVTF